MFRFNNMANEYKAQSGIYKFKTIGNMIISNAIFGLNPMYVFWAIFCS